MLYDKVLPSFYFIEVENQAVRALIDRQFNIKKVIIASTPFDNDIVATEAAKDVVKFFIKSSPIDTSCATEDLKLNPEFYPTAEGKSQEERELHDDLHAAELEDHGAPQGGIVVSMTHHFDAVGDFVQTRSIVEGKDFKITTRIAVSPDVYMKSKIEADSRLRLASPHREERQFWLQ